MSTTELHADVVIMGGGIAGCIAARRAHEQGARVLLLDKARSVRRSGDAGHGLAFITTYLDSGDGEDSAAEFARWYVEIAEGLVDPDVVGSVAVEPMHAGFAYLENLGVSLRDPDSGEYRRVKRLWEKGPQLVQIRGDDIKPKLTDALEQAGVPFLGGVHVAGILKTADGRVAGVVGVGVRDAGLVVVKAPAVILASGSTERVMRTPSGNGFNTYHRPYHAATGFAVASKAGAELANIEFLGTFMMQRGFPTGAALNLVEAGAQIVNGRGESVGEVPDDTGERTFGRGIVGKAVREVINGRGPLFVDCRQMPAEKLAEVMGYIHYDGPAFPEFIRQSGLDPGLDLIEIDILTSVWSATGSPKGVLIDGTCQTRVPGLFAIGDLATPSYSFAGAITTGYVAGPAAVKAARALGPAEPAPEQIDAENDRLRHHLDVKSDLGWKEVELQIQDTMAHYVGIDRSRLGLERAELLLAFYEREAARVQAGDPHELMRALEVCDIAGFSRLMTAAALARDESRFGYHMICHYRSDFPEPDDARWKGVANVVTSSADQAHVAQRRMS